GKLLCSPRVLALHSTITLAQVDWNRKGPPALPKDGSRIPGTTRPGNQSNAMQGFIRPGRGRGCSLESICVHDSRWRHSKVGWTLAMTMTAFDEGPPKNTYVMRNCSKICTEAGLGCSGRWTWRTASMLVALTTLWPAYAQDLRLPDVELPPPLAP